MKVKLTTTDGREIELILTAEQAEKLGVKKEVKKWDDLGEISGHFINIDSRIEQVNDALSTPNNQNIFATENQAKGVLAMAQLSQLMKHVGGGWREGEKNFCLEWWSGRIHPYLYTSSAKFLAFPTEEIRDKFLENHRELIEQYFLIYQ